MAISRVISSALDRTHVPNGAVQLVTTRDVIPQLLALDRHIDLVIPRGSNDLVRYVKSATRIPVLGHADGLCAVYLDATADPALAADILVDAKTTYPAACNAVETVLVHERALAAAWPRAAAALLAAGVELRCDAASREALGPQAEAAAGLVVEASEADYDREHLALVLAVSIVTADAAEAERFMAGVDSAGAFWNASTRMADGMRYGFGTEVGISTNKIHARGPVGLEGLMIYKYKLRGAGHVSAVYGEGEGKRRFKHESLPID